ncbi:MAG: DUF4190 domain-containing protein [Bifidobacteriaceae bacterium]|nr:DUF4190 domain-containing protein [Bifidobacteriaceae bacterium]
MGNDPMNDSHDSRVTGGNGPIESSTPQSPVPAQVPGPAPAQSSDFLRNVTPMMPLRAYGVGGAPEIITRSPLAIAGLVIGIAALAMFWTPVLNFIISAVGIGVSIAGIVDASPRKQKTGRGMAIVGLVLSILGVIAAIVMTVLAMNVVVANIGA